jgi:hypothetical protein
MSASANRPFSRDQRTTIVYGMLVFVLIVVCSNCGCSPRR